LQQLASCHLFVVNEIVVQYVIADVQISIIDDALFGMMNAE